MISGTASGGVRVGVGELLDRIREHYVTQFTAAAKKLGRRRGVQVASEVVLCNEDGEAVGEGSLGLPMRLDLVAVKGGVATESVSVDSDRMPTFPPIRFAWSSGLTVTLCPFPWDNLTARIPAAAGTSGYGPLVGWFREWFREDEDGAGEPIGVIHFLSDPETVGGEVRFTADLGSAPVEAFEGLLDALAALGAAEVVIGEAA
jgi:hypothetical protein